jgi:methylated-DNA-[protein]-cysteine S-methyltransferase
MTITYHPVATPLGTLRAFHDQEALIGLYFVGQRYDRVVDSAATEMPPSDARAERLTRWLAAYSAGDDLPYPGPVRCTGTPLQQAVWAALQGIPFGATRTYGDIARAVGRGNAARAVGAAIGRNPISIIVPCHRVLGANGQLTGYAGGLDRKQALLAAEAARVRARLPILGGVVA